MGKGPFSLARSATRRRHHRKVAEIPTPTPPTEPAGSPAIIKAKKKAGGTRLWMRFDRLGRSELVELDRNAVTRRAAIPARDLRILGPLFSHSSNILGNGSLFCYV